MELAGTILRQAGLLLLLIAGLTLILIAAEMAFPRGPLSSVRTRWRAFLFTVVFQVASMAVGALSAIAIVRLGVGGLAVDLSAFIGGVGAAIVGFVAFDFLNYWMHRAQHRFEFLWRFHAVHHSIEEMGAPTGYQHIAEPVFRVFFCVLPLAFILKPEALALITALSAFQGYYQHSATSLNFGRFAWVICDNRVHRIHHSIGTEQAYNFGVTTLLWDKLFGTAHFPSRDEWPQVGLEGYPEPRSVREYILQPFLSRSVESAATRRQIP